MGEGGCGGMGSGKGKQEWKEIQKIQTKWWAKRKEEGRGSSGPKKGESYEKVTMERMGHKWGEMEKDQMKERKKDTNEVKWWKICRMKESIETRIRQ